MSWDYYTIDSKLFMTTETKCVSLESFRRPSLTEYELAYILHMNENKVEKRENWYSYKGDMWYIKERCNVRSIMNELLGEYLSLYMDLPTIHYVLLVSNGKIVGIASKNFREKDISYKNAIKLTNREHNRINRVLLSRPTIFNCKYKKQMYNYLMRNFYANQGDRMHNVLCECKFERNTLAPLYDYEMSFMIPESDILIEPFFLGLDINTYLLGELTKRDKSMQDSVDKILSFNMNDALDYIEDENKILIPEDLKTNYLNYDKKRKKLILDKINVLKK